MIGSPRWCSIDPGALPRSRRAAEMIGPDPRPARPPRLPRANVAGRPEVAPADQRTNFARAGIERHEAAFQVGGRLASLRDLRDPRAKAVLGGALHLGVVAGVDAQPALEHLLAAIARHEL